MLAIMNFAWRVSGGKEFFIQTRRKFTKADVIKRIMREQKQTFGALIETKREKARRLKSEKTGEKPVQNVSDMDSELSWMMKISDTRLRRIRVIGNNKSLESAQEAIDAKKITRIYNKSSSCELASAPKKPNEKIAKVPQDRKPAIVQKRIIRISPGTENTVDDLPDFVITKSSSFEVKSKSSQRRLIRASHGSEDDSQIFGKSTDEPKMKESKKASSMILSSENKFIPSVTEAPLFLEREENSDDSLYDSKIINLSVAEDKESLKLPSVTKILNVTMSEQAKKMLEFWMARMIKQLGQEGFDEYKRDLVENGKLLHSSIDSALRKIPVQVPEKLKPCFDSVQSVLEEIKHVRAIESHVVHHNLGYRGVLDCVASYRGNMCLIDWKKSDRTKHLLSSTYDAPLQIASYIGALNADKNYPFQIKSGLIVIAYTTGNPPTVYQFDETKLQFYWKQWLGRLKKYYTMQST